MTIIWTDHINHRRAHHNGCAVQHIGRFVLVGRDGVFIGRMVEGDVDKEVERMARELNETNQHINRW